MAAPNPDNSNSRPARPTLKQTLSSASFLQDHEQYRVPNVPNLGDVLRNSRDVPTAPLVLNANPIKPNPEKVADSGIVHSIFPHDTEVLPPGTPKLVATLYYKSSNPVHRYIHPDISVNLGDKLSPPVVPEGSAPTDDMEKFPREPPAPEPEPLDHLYGPFVSQICLTSFLQNIESVSTPYQRTHSSHRCLDQLEQPRVVEVTFWPPPNPEYLTFADLRKHESIWRFEREWNVEVVLQKESVFRRHKRLAVFDMDSTLIQNEVIDEIAKYIGVEKEVSVRVMRVLSSTLAGDVADIQLTRKSRLVL